MSWRALLVLAVAVGVASPAGAAPEPATEVAVESSTETPPDRKPTSKRARKTTKRTTAKSKKQRLSKKQKTRKKKKKKKKKRTKTVSRTPSKATLRNVKNMPRGYAWPPTAPMRVSEKACQARLDELGVPWQPVATEGRIVAPMTIEDPQGAMTLGGITYTSAYRKGPHKVDCHLALALEQFGPQLYVLGVREIKFGSIFRWTNVRVNGETKPFLSRHALGIAVDINSFTDASGREIVVETEYPKGDVLLLAIEEVVNASGRFRILLTPKNDPVSHRDHFHLEVAVDYTAPVAAL